VDSILKRQSSIIGLVAAAIAAVYYVVIWKYQLYSDAWISLIRIIVPILLGVMAQILAKRALNGSITLKQCVLAYFIVVMFFFVTEALVNYLIFVVIDPAAQNFMLEAALKVQEQNPNTAAASGVFKQPEYTLTSYIGPMLSSILFYTIAGILTGFFIKNIKTTS
jgi:hypothetical protein